MAKEQPAFNPDLEYCIDNCLECYRVCWETFQYCLRVGGNHADWTLMRLLTDCAQLCQTSADFMIRGSELHAETCRACSEVCARCADACAALAGEDDLMQDCADTCTRCAESCERLAGERKCVN
jgi:hypothetical protein